MPNRLKTIREMRNLTLEEVGDHLGISHSTVLRWESGKYPFGSDRALELARFYKVHPGELFAELPTTGVANPIEKQAVTIVRALAPAERDQWLSMGVTLARKSQILHKIKA